MKKFYLAAALLLATTSAHAGGNTISFQIEGHRIRIEAPRNCSSLDCIKVTAPEPLRFEVRRLRQVQE